jgi:hypothetical protein
VTATGVLFTAVEFKPVPSISDVGIVERMVWQEGGRALVGRVRSRDCNRKRPHLKYPGTTCQVESCTTTSRGRVPRERMRVKKLLHLEGANGARAAAKDKRS